MLLNNPNNIVGIRLAVAAQGVGSLRGFAGASNIGSAKPLSLGGAGLGLGDAGVCTSGEVWSRSSTSLRHTPFMWEESMMRKIQFLNLCIHMYLGRNRI